MNIIKVKDYQALSEKLAELMIDEIASNDRSNICLATGGSPKLAYQLFTEAILKQQLDTSHVVFTKLDEWCNLDPTHLATCEKYIQDLIVKPLGITENNYISFIPNASDFEVETKRIQQALNKRPITLCLLGLGMNGHLGLNEPGEFLTPYAHVVALDPITKTHPMIKNDEVDFGLSLGMADILASDKIVLLIAGANKAKIVEQFFTKKITTKLPASFLWLHQNVQIILQEDLYTIE